MIETDRRKLIIGAVSALFVGLTPDAIKALELPKREEEVSFGLAVFRSQKLWQAIYEAMYKAYTESMGKEPTDAHEWQFIEVFADTLYENIKATERLLDSFQINVASADTLNDWEKTQRMSPSVTIK
jgi:hypothetical protein